ncbi:hypothetical protein WDW37_15350 [Bdellovibrionota bacterium FG-1]
MNQRVRQWVGAGVFGCCLTWISCGSGSEPLALLGDPGARFNDSLVLPYNAASGGVGGVAIDLWSVTPFSASQASADGFDFIYHVSGSYAILAPWGGLVTAVDTASVTIWHNVHVSTRLSRMTSAPSVRVGDFIAAGTQLSTTAINSPSVNNLVHFSVLVDGVAVCPYGFLAPTAKTSLNTVLRRDGLEPCTE